MVIFHCFELHKENYLLPLNWSSAWTDMTAASEDLAFFSYLSKQSFSNAPAVAVEQVTMLRYGLAPCLLQSLTLLNKYL